MDIKVLHTSLNTARLTLTIITDDICAIFFVVRFLLIIMLMFKNYMRDTLNNRWFVAQTNFRVGNYMGGKVV